LPRGRWTEEEEAAARLASGRGLPWLGLGQGEG